MKAISYKIEFHPQNTDLLEEQWFNSADTAWAAFRLFAEPDSLEMYSRVELTEVDFAQHRERLMAALEFHP